MNNTQTVQPITNAFYSFESTCREPYTAADEAENMVKEFLPLLEAVEKVRDLIEIGQFEVVETSEEETILRQEMFFGAGWRYVIVAEAGQF